MPPPPWRRCRRVRTTPSMCLRRISKRWPSALPRVAWTAGPACGTRQALPEPPCWKVRWHISNASTAAAMTRATTSFLSVRWSTVSIVQAWRRCSTTVGASIPSTLCRQISLASPSAPSPFPHRCVLREGDTASPVGRPLRGGAGWGACASGIALKSKSGAEALLWGLRRGALLAHHRVRQEQTDPWDVGTLSCAGHAATGLGKRVPACFCPALAPRGLNLLLLRDLEHVLSTVTDVCCAWFGHKPLCCTAKREGAF